VRHLGRFKFLSLLIAGFLTLTAVSNPTVQSTVKGWAPDHTVLVASLNKFSAISPSVVLLESEVHLSPTDSTTVSYSGVIVKRKGPMATILTVAHGCTPAGMAPSVLTVYQNDSAPVVGRLIKSARNPMLEGDLCLIEAPVKGRPMPIAWHYTPGFGDKIYSVGSPAGVLEFPVEGYMSGPVGPIDTYLISLPVSPGYSGGPLVFRGNLIGIVTATVPIIAHGALAESVGTIEEFMRDAK